MTKEQKVIRAKLGLLELAKQLGNVSQSDSAGPLANSRFHHRPDPQHLPNSRLEAAYHSADTAIQRVVDLFAAA
jgi:hypothetical protein